MALTEAQKRAIKKYRQSKKGKEVVKKMNYEYYNNNKDKVINTTMNNIKFKKECEKLRLIDC